MGGAAPPIRPCAHLPQTVFRFLISRLSMIIPTFFGVTVVAFFLAEFGDKTQLATLLFSSDKDVDKLLVFASASLALVLSVAIAVVAGGTISQYVNETVLRYTAAAGFILIGIWTLFTT